MQSIFCPLPRFIPGRITTWLVLSQEAAALELQLCRGQVSGIGSFSFIWSDRDAYLTCHTINTISSSYLACLALLDPD